MTTPYDFCEHECDGYCPFFTEYGDVCSGTGCPDYEPCDKEVL